MRNIFRASGQVASSNTNNGRLPGSPSCDVPGNNCVTTRAGSTNSPGNTTYGCHCGSASRASSAGSTSVRAQPKAKVSGTTSAISQPVLVGLSGSMSNMIRHTPAVVGTTGRSEHRQWLNTTRQPGQRSELEPRAIKGLALRASRAARRRETACAIWRAGTARKACCRLGRAGRRGTACRPNHRASRVGLRRWFRRWQRQPHGTRRPAREKPC